MQRLLFQIRAIGVSGVITAALSALCANAGNTQPHPLSTVTVLAVNNGQEVLVDLDGKGRAVRLACLQAPLAQQTPWSSVATAQLRKALPVGSEVTLELRARDVYGRVIARLLFNRMDVAEPLLVQGSVFAYDGYLGQCDDLDYAGFEAQAREASRGIWRVPGGLERPWDLIEASGGELEP
jgi:endonuclease YncB( thermonuclease family)